MDKVIRSADHEDQSIVMHACTVHSFFISFFLACFGLCEVKYPNCSPSECEHSRVVDLKGEREDKY